MRCPYCGAEVVGRKCIFCTSDLIDFIKKNGLEVADFLEETPTSAAEEIVKEAAEAKDKSKNKNKKKNRRDRTNADGYVLDDIRSMCVSYAKAHHDYLGSYDVRREVAAGKGVKSRLFEVLNIPDGEEVFLIHDDTLMGSGKNGFAITEKGFYCKEQFEKLVITKFADIQSDEEVKKSDYTIHLENRAGGKRTICYLTGSQEVLGKLPDLYNDILDALFEED